MNRVETMDRPNWYTLDARERFRSYPEAVRESIPKDGAGNPLYRCWKVGCDASFSMPQNLRIHVLRTHDGQTWTNRPPGWSSPIRATRQMAGRLRRRRSPKVVEKPPSNEGESQPPKDGTEPEAPGPGGDAGP